MNANVILSEKGGVPNGVRNLLQAVLFISGGACANAGYWWWALLLTIAAVALFGLNVVHYFSDNYDRGFKDGVRDGSRARGLVLQEEDLLEGAYRVLAKAPCGGGWLVLLADANLDGREPRVYQISQDLPPIFRKERWRDQNNPNPDAVTYGYMPLARIP